MQKIGFLSLILVGFVISLVAFSEDAYASEWRYRTISSSSPGCIDDIATDDSNPSDDDIDKDGICDRWEGDGTQSIFDPDWPDGNTYSVSCADIDGCPVLGVRDIYVEIDYMDGHQPDMAAINQVKTSFAALTNPPYRLHVVIDEVVLPFSDTTRFPGYNTQTGWGFDQVKACHFGTPAERGGTATDPLCGWSTSQNKFSKKAVFHYALFVNKQAASPTSSGIAEVFGNDLMISLGSFSGGVGSTDEQAGTFMHELGHNLGLRHGGGDDMNCKPNYLSVMSYSRQFSNLVSDRDLNYSSAIVTRMGGGPTEPLDENALDELVGLSNYESNSQRITYGPIPPLVLPTTGGDPIDWDLSGIADNSAASNPNTNDISGCPASVYQAMPGFSDWDNVKLRFTQSGSSYSDGASSTTAGGASLGRILSGGISLEGDTEGNDKEALSVIKEDKKNSEITKEAVIAQYINRIDSLDCFLNLEDCEYQNPPADELYVSVDKNEKNKIKMEAQTMTRSIKDALKVGHKEDMTSDAGLKMAIEKIKEIQTYLRGKLKQDASITFLEGTNDIIKSFEIASDHPPKIIHKEICGDGIDNNYDGKVDEACPVRGEELTTGLFTFIIAMIVIAISVAAGMVSLRRRP